MFDLIQERDEGPILGPRTTVFVVIPAETEHDHPDRLTDRGRIQLEELVRSRLIPSVSHIYAPPSKAAMATANILKEEFGARLTTEEDIDEVSLGKNGKDPKKMAETLRAIWNNPEFVPHNGESIEQAEDRIASQMNKIASKHRGDSIMVILPPMIGTLFITLVTGGIATMEQWLATGHASCAMFEHQRTSWSLVMPLDNSFLSDPSTVQDSLPDEIVRALLE